MTLADLINEKPGARDPASVRAWLEEEITVPDPTLVTSRNVMARLSIASASTVFATLRAGAAADVLVAEALEQLRGEGLDLSHANAIAMINQLFPAELAAEVAALGTKQIARWQQVEGLDRLKEGYILEVLDERR